MISLKFEFVVNSTLMNTWSTLVSLEKTKVFFSPDVNIEFKKDGLYEIYFNIDAPIGEKGSEEMRILLIEPTKKFSFSWNNPPFLKLIRGKCTRVDIVLEEISKLKTNVIFVNSEFGESGEWIKSIDYFIRAWGKIVLPRFKYVVENKCDSFESVPKVLAEIYCKKIKK